MNKDEARFAVSLAVRELYRRPSKMRMYDVINCSDRHAAACVAEAREPLVTMETAAKLTDAVEVQWDAGAERFRYSIYGERCTREEAAAALGAKETP